MDGAVAHFQEQSTPTVLIVELAGSKDEILDKLGGLAGVCDAGTSVIVVGSENDITLYRALLQQGVSEYLAQPVTAAQIFEAVHGIVSDPDAREPATFIVFYGARGGVGSSTVAHNTAWALAEQTEEEVALIDMDLQFGTGALSFNLELRQGVNEALADPSRLDPQLLERYLGKYGEYLQVLGSPANPAVASEITVEGVDKLMDVMGAMAPIVVMDMPHTWSDWVFNVLMRADLVVLTTNMDLVCLRNAQNVISLLNQDRADQAPIKIVANQVGHSQRTELTQKDFENAIDGEVTLSIADEPQTFGNAENAGQPVAQAKGRSKVSGKFEELATIVGSKKPEVGKKKSKLSWLKLSG